jgi:phosphatidylglycerophosphatase A
VLGVWFGCGYFPRAPGTAGTVGAIPLYLALRHFGTLPVAVCALVLLGIGIWAADRVAKQTGQKDPQIVCIDEVVGVLITWLGAPQGLVGMLAGFVLFRVLDTVKPWPASLAERRLAGGWGIMLDDVAAGIWGLVLLLAAQSAGWLL